tara:strand:- start:14110 stop:14904 length:795 start_codon:yes stop_codon:yes gene_type:complete
LYLAGQKKTFLRKFIFYSFFTLLTILSCKKDDNSIDVRDIAEQALLDDSTLKIYLETHFYNYEDFNKADNFKNMEITLDSIYDENINKDPLIDKVLKKNIPIESSNGTINHVLYYLPINSGVGENPTIVDSVYVSYKGSLLDGSVFDQSITPIWFDLTGVVRGFKEGISEFKPGDFIVNDDNTVDYQNYGQGLIFMPSGLGYFSQSSSLIPEYSPLIFKISLFTIKKTDHDGDGILTSDEYDNDNDGVPDDSDGDGILDYLDKD